MTTNTVNAKAVTKRIASFAKRGVTWQTDAHDLAMDCIRLSMPIADGGSFNAAPAAALLNAFPKGTRVKALVAWFKAFSNVVPLLDDKTGLYNCKMVGPKAVAYKVVDLLSADATPFWTPAEASTSPSAFSLGDSLANLIARAVKAGEAGKLSAADAVALEAIQTAAKLVPAK